MNWRTASIGKRERQTICSGSVMQTCLTLKGEKARKVDGGRFSALNECRPRIFGIAFRQIIGLGESLFALLRLDWPVPGSSTRSRSIVRGQIGHLR